MNNYDELENMVRKITKDEAAGITPDSSGVQNVLRKSKRRGGNGYRMALAGGVAVIAALGFAVYPKGGETVSQVPDAASQAGSNEAASGKSQSLLESETTKQLDFLDSCMAEKGFSIDTLSASDINPFRTFDEGISTEQDAYNEAIGTGSSTIVEGSCADALNIDSVEGKLLFEGKIDGELLEDVAEGDLLEDYPAYLELQKEITARDEAQEGKELPLEENEEYHIYWNEDDNEDMRKESRVVIDFISEQDDLSLDTKAKAIAVFEYDLNVDKAQTASE